MPHGETPREGQLLRGSLFNEPMRIETVRPSGDGTWVLGLVGVQSERFRKVTKVAHYWLEVNAMTRPMMIREDSPKYGGDEDQ